MTKKETNFGKDGRIAGTRRKIAGKRYKPSPKSMGILLKQHGVDLKPNTIDLLWKYHRLIHTNNQDGDLTRLRAFETMVERHYADCCLLNAFVDNWPDRMIDIGTGAGFPGIPLKIVNPNINFTLCEPRNVRVDFLNMAIQKLDLKNINVFGHKITSASLDFPVKGVITRAFEDIDKTLVRIQNSLEIGGRAFFMKGPALKEELKTQKLVGYEIEKLSWYNIPNSKQERAFIELRRIK
jgi:16S rRNA (guanine527-N7)-methyltransferase